MMNLHILLPLCVNKETTDMIIKSIKRITKRENEL